MTWDNSTRASRLPRGWARLRLAILKRDNYTCCINGMDCTRVATEVDHIHAGDDHSPSNLQSVCTTCHKHKTKREALAARAARPGRLRVTESHPADVR